MNAGKKLLSQARSSALVAIASNGTIASSSIRVNMSVESSTDIWGGSPLLSAVSAFTMVSW